MSSLALKALHLLAAGALSMTATAQVTYRCGNSYSQTPCPDAVIVNTDDKRTAEQKAQTDMATQRGAKTADAMEKARLQQEARDLAANTPTSKASGPAAAGKKKTDPSKKRKTAHSKAMPSSAPGQAKNKKAPVPTSAKQDPGKA